MTKYRLKKDTPAFRSGYIFETDPKDEGILLDKEGVSAFYENEIENFDEWFEEVDQCWKPQYSDLFCYVDDAGDIRSKFWGDSSVDKIRWSLGNCFKTEKAAERYRDYLEAVATVRQDEGVLTPEKVRETLNQYGTVYTVGTNATALSVKHFYNASAGAVYFDTLYNANTSIGNHLDEWTIITNYDWSRK